MPALHHDEVSGAWAGVRGHPATKLFELRLCSVLPYVRLAGVAKWQTHQTQNLAVATPCGFDSRPRHQPPFAAQRRAEAVTP